MADSARAYSAYSGRASSCCEEAGSLLDAPAEVTCLASTDDKIVVGTAEGRLQTWRLHGGGSAVLHAAAQLSASAVDQLQLLPAVGIVLHRCSGAVGAHGIDDLHPAAAIHQSRATLFDADGARAPVGRLAVCAGHSLVWVYDLEAKPQLVWRRVLPEPTRALRLDSQSALAAGGLAPRGRGSWSCFILCASSGALLSTLSLQRAGAALPPPSAEWRCSGSFVPPSDADDADDAECLLLLPPPTAAADPRGACGAWWIAPRRGALWRASAPDQAGEASTEGSCEGGAALLPGLVLLRTSGALLLVPVERSGGGEAPAAGAPPPVEFGAPLLRVDLDPGCSARPRLAIAHGLHAVLVRGRSLHAVPLCRARGGSASPPHPLDWARSQLLRDVAAADEASLDEIDALLLRAARLAAAVAAALRKSDALAAASPLPTDVLPPRTRPAAPPLAAAGEGSKAAAAQTLWAEEFVFGAAGTPLHAACVARLAGAQQRLVRGALAAVRDGGDAFGVPRGALENMGGVAELWAAASEPTALPSERAAALAALCGVATRAVRLTIGREASAEELLPCIAHSMATAIAAGDAPELLASLRLTALHVSSAAEPNEEYCVTTVQVAARAVEDHSL